MSARGDHSELFAAAVTLRTALDNLWALRAYKDQNWVSILDLIQSALMQLAKSDRLETLDADQCTAFKELVEVSLSPATKTTDDLIEATRRVAELGLSAFEGFEPLAGS
ncbi:hypothetical protein [Fimbriiglobus ruber]|nr:hypothetical protein [Fimbriiglobus ruber]